MTRAEALTAFFNAVDQYMPTHDLIGRSAIRQAGINYASAAAQDAVTSTLAICQRQDYDRHLLDGVAPSPEQPQTEGLRQDGSAPLRLVRPTDAEDTQ